MTDSIKASARSGILWGAGSQALSLVLQLLQAVVAARILGPEQYAAIAVIYVVAAIALPFAQSGLGIAIIYFRESDPKKIAQVQGLSVIVASLAAAAVYALAEPAAAYFRLPDAALLVQIAAIAVWFSAICSVWQSLLKRNLSFRDVEVAYVVSYALGFAIVMLGLWAGYGAVSVIAGQAAAALFNAVLTRWALHKRGIACGIAWPGPSILPHLRYGGANTLSAVASVLNDRVDAMVIGGSLSAAAFGTYGLFSRIITAVSTPIQRIKTQVEFPTFTHIIKEVPRLRRAFTKAMALTSLVTFPIFLGLAAIADLAVRLALGLQWQAYGAVLSVMCVYGLLRIISSSSTPVFMAAGHVRRALYFVFARLAVTPVIILATLAVWPTLIAVAIAVTVTQAAVIIANYLLFVRPVLGPCAGALALLLGRPLIASVFMIAAVVAVRRFYETPSLLALAVASIAAGALAYGLASLVFNWPAIKEALYVARPLLDGLRGRRRPGIVD